MSDSGIDPVKFGQMLAQLEALNGKLPTLEAAIATFERRMTDVEGRFKIGRGLLFGLVLGLGFAAYGVKTTLFKLAGLE